MQASILFVDDDPGITQLLTRLFYNSDYRITTANNGEKALKCIEKTPFNVIVSDQRMPIMGGFMLLKKAHRKQPSAIKLMLSGRDEARLYCTKLQPEFIHSFILKPWLNDELLTAIDQAVRHSLKNKNATTL